APRYSRETLLSNATSQPSAASGTTPSGDSSPAVSPPGRLAPLTLGADHTTRASSRVGNTSCWSSAIVTRSPSPHSAPNGWTPAAFTPQFAPSPGRIANVGTTGVPVGQPVAGARVPFVLRAPASTSPCGRGKVTFWPLITSRSGGGEEASEGSQRL